MVPPPLRPLLMLLPQHDAEGASQLVVNAGTVRVEREVDPQNGNAAYELANFQEQIGNSTAARQQYEHLLQQFREFEEALVGLASVNLALQKPADAVPLLEHVTHLKSNDEVASRRLAQADRATGNQEGQRQALATFQKIHQTIPVTLRKPNATDEITPQQVSQSPGP